MNRFICKVLIDVYEIEVVITRDLESITTNLHYVEGFGGDTILPHNEYVIDKPKKYIFDELEFETRYKYKDIYVLICFKENEVIDIKLVDEDTLRMEDNLDFIDDL